MWGGGGAWGRGEDGSWQLLEGEEQEVAVVEELAQAGLEHVSKGSAHAEKAGASALTAAQKALKVGRAGSCDLALTDAGKALANTAVSSADAGVSAVEKALTCLRTYTEMSSTVRDTQSHMRRWRMAGTVDEEMEASCTELLTVTLKTANQAAKEAARAAIHAAVKACEVSRLLHNAVGELAVRQAEKEKAEAEARAKKEKEQEQEKSEEDDQDAEEELRKQKEAEEQARKELEEEEENLPNDAASLEKRVQVLLRVKNAMVLQEANAAVVSLQTQMHSLLPNRLQLLSVDKAVVQPISISQKRHLFSLLADLFDQGCDEFEKAAEEARAVQAAEKENISEEVPREAVLRAWWRDAYDSWLGWVLTGVKRRELAMPAPRVQVLRLASVVDMAAVCSMVETEVIRRVATIVHNLSDQSEIDSVKPFSEDSWRASNSELSAMCDDLILNVQGFVQGL
ncbi:hypothetical protein CYMTET_28284 [Cymbomonas tetramitiformis]|uniref:Uncharacterized protein n=1 Tax=Cymbomonas tetramitiformis TaxID=36881 RepID=A0AAE0FN62_9CHLO|nr:hypothetical protein CYMTET_28284 [Cymbomonas tetramitiformis]